MPNDEIPSAEADAMCMDRAAVIRVVSALREYRNAARRLLDGRYSDGEVDGCSMTMFGDRVEEIEASLRDDD